MIKQCHSWNVSGCPQLHLPLCDRMDCSPPGSSVHEIPKQEYWNGLSFPPPGVCPDPGTEFASPASPALAGRFFTTEPPGKPMYMEKTII